MVGSVGFPCSLQGETWYRAACVLSRVSRISLVEYSSCGYLHRAEAPGLPPGPRGSGLGLPLSCSSTFASGWVGFQHDHTLVSGIWLDTPGRLAGGDVPAVILVDALSGDGLVIGPGMHVVGSISERAFGFWYAAGSTF